LLLTAFLDGRRLEQHHGYIQWLFPLHEDGMNGAAQVLQRHEAAAMRASPTVMVLLYSRYRS